MEFEKEGPYSVENTIHLIRLLDLYMPKKCLTPRSCPEHASCEVRKKAIEWMEHYERKLSQGVK